MVQVQLKLVVVIKEHRGSVQKCKFPFSNGVLFWQEVRLQAICYSPNWTSVPQPVQRMPPPVILVAF